MGATMKNKKAVIMMATYNGAKYLSKQLESLENQTFKNWELYVSDDGSSDKTLDILKKYQKKDSRVKKIISNNGPHGAFNNYFNVMFYVKEENNNYDYYFFCDQDDIWVTNKMEYQIDNMNKYDIPYMNYSNLEFINKDGKDLHETMNDITDIELKNPYNIFFSYRYVWGTTLAFNKALWNKMYIEPNKGLDISHDNYVSKNAVIFGKVEFIPKSLVLYRRHGDNVSDIPGKYNLLGIIKRLTVSFPKIINNHAQIYWDDLYLIKHIKCNDIFLLDLKKCINQGGKISLNFLKKYKIKTSSKKLSELSIKFILYTKLYKLTNSFNRDLDV